MGAAASLSEGSGQPVVLHVITDLQASGSPLHLADLQPPQGMTLDLIDAGGTEAANQRIDAVEWSATAVNTVDVTVGGDLPLGKPRELRLFIDGVERGRKALDPSRAAPYVEHFTVADLVEGEHRPALCCRRVTRWLVMTRCIACCGA
jgi:hypothetical protein